MEWIYPLIIALLSFGVSGLLTLRFCSTKDRSTRDWSLAFLFHGLSYFLATAFVGQWFVFNETMYFFVHFLRQTFVSLLFIAIYCGVIRLLTNKKSLTLYFPLVFFTLQTLLLLYFDFVLHDVTLADQMHIIFFDIPFNMIIAVLFLKFYLVSKMTYSMLISIAWFGYTATVPIFFYTYGNAVLFSLSLLPMIIMLIAFIFYYQSPSGQAILDVVPVVEKRTPPPTKYKLTPGSTYTIEEEKSKAAFEVFTDSVFHGVRGLCVTRTIPTEIRETFELKKTPVLWLTHIHNDMQVVDPNELEQLVALVDKFVANSKNEFEREVVETTPHAPPSQKIVPLKPFVINDIGRDETVKTEELQKPVDPIAKVQESSNSSLKQMSKPLIIHTIGGDEKSSIVAQKIQSSKASRSSTIVPPVYLPKPESALLLSTNSSKLLTTQPSTPPVLYDSEDNILSSLLADARPLSEIIPNIAQKSLPTVNAIVERFKTRAEDKKSTRDKDWEAKNAKLVKKNKLGFTVIGDDEEVSADTEHTAHLEISPNAFHKSVIVIDGLEYLINNNNFNSVLHVLQLMKDKISQCDSVLLLPVNPLTMDEQHMSILRGELEHYEPEKNINI